jgi:PKD repeat protein
MNLWAVQNHHHILTKDWELCSDSFNYRKDIQQKYFADFAKINVSYVDASFATSTASGTSPLEVEFIGTSSDAAFWA